MNAAHFHLVVNHLPIVSVLIGTLILITGFILKKPVVRLTALGVFIFGALCSIAAFYSGEGAEEVVEQLPRVSEALIHTHEELAETFFTLTLVLGAASLLSFMAELKKNKYARHLMLLVLVLGIASAVLAKFVGTSGGEINHPEIQNGFNP